jgi:hypothetical protein
MKTYADIKDENKSRAVASSLSTQKSNSKPTFQFVDNRPEAISQRKLQEMVNNSQQVEQLDQLQAIADNDSKGVAQRVNADNPRKGKTWIPEETKQIVRLRNQLKSGSAPAVSEKNSLGTLWVHTGDNDSRDSILPKVDWSKQLRILPNSPTGATTGDLGGGLHVHVYAMGDGTWDMHSKNSLGVHRPIPDDVRQDIIRKFAKIPDMRSAARQLAYDHQKRKQEEIDASFDEKWPGDGRSTLLGDPRLSANEKFRLTKRMLRKA